MSLKKNVLTILLAVVVLFGAAVRFFMLDRFPNGFFRDEAALGYNAYAIWRTGGDEYGMRFPVVFRSFEVFFLPAYIYLSAPIVGLFGLNVFDTRFLAAFSGVVALLAVWFIVRELWGDKRLSLLAVLLLAISPWHVFYSRGAFEGNLALTLFSLGFLFWLKLVKSRRMRYLFLSSLFFVVSMYSYQAERLVVPLFGLVAALLSRETIWQARYKVAFTVLLPVLMLIPLLKISFDAGGLYRAYNVSVFSKSGEPPGWQKGVESGLLINNVIYLRLRQFASLYLSYFSPRNLFVDGDPNRQRSVDNFSVLYTWMLLFLVIGLVDGIKRRGMGEKLLLAWMLLGPLPASATSDPFHTYRAFLTFMPMTILTARGLFIVLKEMRTGRRVMVAALALIAAYSFTQFLFVYFVEDSFARAKDWDYGYQELIGYLDKVHGAKKIVIDDPKTTPYVQLLFFGKVDPRDYQSEAEKIDVLRQYYTSSANLRPSYFADFEFRRVNWRAERGDSGKVFVMANFLLPPSEFKGDPNVKLLKEIDYPDGETAFRVVRIR